jgi:hypothetical protein
VAREWAAILISLPVASETVAGGERRGETRGRREPRGGASTANGFLLLALSADMMHAGHTSRLPSHFSLQGLANQMLSSGPALRDAGNSVFSRSNYSHAGSASTAVGCKASHILQNSGCGVARDVTVPRFDRPISCRQSL